VNAQTPSTDAEAVQRIARAAAHRLAGEKDPRIENDVEALLQTVDSTKSTPDQYFVDPISLSALIVSVAALSWTIYQDLRKQTQVPSTEVITRRVRLELSAGKQISKSDRDQVIDLVVEELTTRLDT
jgi:hypothetical protein